jgi:hypothetical protein
MRSSCRRNIEDARAGERMDRIDPAGLFQGDIMPNATARR